MVYNLRQVVMDKFISSNIFSNNIFSTVKVNLHNNYDKFNLKNGNSLENISDIKFVNISSFSDLCKYIDDNKIDVIICSNLKYNSQEIKILNNKCNVLSLCNIQIINNKRCVLSLSNAVIDVSNKLVKIVEQNINKYTLNTKKTVVILTSSQGGGTTKYVNDLQTVYSSNNDFKIINKKGDFVTINLHSNDIIIITHLFRSDISIDDIIMVKTRANCKVILTIHDCYWLNTIISKKISNWVHNSYLTFKKNNTKSIIDKLFDICDLVIFPSKFIHDVYSNLFDNKNFIIYEHIDLKTNIYKDFYIPKINGEINIGNFSAFTEYKGSQQVDYLYKNITNYNGHKINYFIVGKNIPSYSENEFFNLLKSYNIHGLLYLNKWGETWSYSLTKGLRSGLPIYYNNIGCFKERISENDLYVKNIDIEDNYHNMDMLKNNFFKFLDAIILHKDKCKKNVDYNIEINKNIMYNSLLENNNVNLNKINFFDDYIQMSKIKPIKNQNIVLITSKLVGSNVGYTYVKTSSICTVQERYDQLVDTISSIKTHIQDAYIILIDNSVIDNDKYTILTEIVDLFINNTNNIYLNEYTDNSKYKGYGELAQILYVFNNFLFKYKNLTFKNFFKISGCYKIVDNIQYILDFNDNVFKKNKNVTDREYYYTSFYKIIYPKIMTFYRSLHKMYINKDNYGKDMEVIIPYEMNYDFTEVDKLNKVDKSNDDVKSNDIKYESIIEKKNILFKNNLKLYPIYFPQFHEIKENNLSFYKGFTDVENLKLLKQENANIKTETPDLNYFGLKDISEYNLTNLHIIEKQINILERYNISGFAMYYYWFSKNTVTNNNNNNMIMETVVNIFFDDKVDLKNKKIFFIWANESWTKNPAFGQSDYLIENSYELRNIETNVKNLMSYFKHKNYLKIDNKPVFLIYHTWFIDNLTLKKMLTHLENECKKNGFDGIHFVLNSMNNYNNNYLNFNLNFNYKNSTTRYRDNKLDINVIDYEKYLTHDISNISFKNIIHTIVFDFDNRARLFKPNKLNLATICINNTIENKKKMVDLITRKYNNKIVASGLENIVLFNAFNEWGEKMTLEPSNEYGFQNLNLIVEELDIINKFPYMFNKYIYNFSFIETNLQYEVINKLKCLKKINLMLVHIHCLDLNVFDEYFLSYLQIIDKFEIIVTFFIENVNIIEKYKEKILFIKISNKGYDIGGKIICLDYIYNNTIQFDYIFFMHSSESDNVKRNLYIKPIINNLDNIEAIIKDKNSEYTGFFPNTIHTADNFFFGTNNYRNEILKYLNCENYETKFAEGNIMILNSRVINYIFKNNLKIFYNILNDKDSFDINWFGHYYNKHSMNPEQLTNMYLSDKSYFSCDFNVKNNYLLRDCMIEHVFERIWFNIISYLGGKCKIFD